VVCVYYEGLNVKTKHMYICVCGGMKRVEFPEKSSTKSSRVL
jgi:hypothetical protein